MKLIGRLRFDPLQRAQFRRGILVEKWARQYPSIFDEDDVRITLKQPQKHFFEWLAAITVFNTTGYLSLVEKYRNRNHTRKQRVLARLFGPEAFHHICTRGTQCPDLLCYSPDFRRCFFCEVKGPNDFVRPEQARRFSRLRNVTGKDVCLMEFWEGEAQQRN